MDKQLKQLKQLDGCAYCGSTSDPDALVLCCRVHVRLVCPACSTPENKSWAIDHEAAA